MATTVVGLDLGSQVVKAVVLSGTGRGYALQRLASRPVLVPAGEEPGGGDPSTMGAIREAARALLADLEIPEATVVAAVPGSRVSTWLVDLPFTQRRQIDLTISGALEDKVPFEMDEVLLDYHIVESGPDLVEGGPGSRIFAAMVPRRQVGRLLEELQVVGVDPRFLTIDAYALAILGRNLEFSQRGTIALLDCGATRSILCILKDGEPQVLRSIDQGGEDLTRALAQHLHISREEAEAWKKADPHRGTTSLEGMNEAIGTALSPLFAELRASLAGWEDRTGFQVEKLFLTGGASRLPGLSSWIEENLGLVADPLELPRGDVDPHLAPAAGPEFALAMGLALRGLQPGRAHSPNLRTAEFAYRKDVQANRVLAVLGVVAFLVMTLLGVGWFALRHHRLSTQRDELEATLLALVKKALPDAPAASLKTPSAAAAALLEEATEMQRKADQLDTPEGNTPLDVIRKLSQAISTDVKVDIDELEVTSERIKMRGQAETFEAVDKVESNLKAHEEFASAYKHDTSKGLGAVIKFSITIPRQEVPVEDPSLAASTPTPPSPAGTVPPVAVPASSSPTTPPAAVNPPAGIPPGTAPPPAAGSSPTPTAAPPSSPSPAAPPPVVAPQGGPRG